MAPGPPPVKTEAALCRRASARSSRRRPAHWTIPRLMAQIEAREGYIKMASRSCPRRSKNFMSRRYPACAARRASIAAEIERVGLRLQLRKAQAEAGDIILLYGDESEALTHPYLARAWALPRCDCGCRAGSGQESGDNRLTRSCHAPVDCAYEPDQAQPRLHRSPRGTRLICSVLNQDGQ